MTELSSEAAREALAMAGDARAAAGARLRTPWAYHVVVGLALGGTVFLQLLTRYGVISSLVILALMGSNRWLLNPLYRRSGVWITGLQSGRATLWTIA